MKCKTGTIYHIKNLKTLLNTVCVCETFILFVKKDPKKDEFTFFFSVQTTLDNTAQQLLKPGAHYHFQARDWSESCFRFPKPLFYFLSNPICEIFILFVNTEKAHFTFCSVPDHIKPDQSRSKKIKKTQNC